MSERERHLSQSSAISARTVRTRGAAICSSPARGHAYCARWSLLCHQRRRAPRREGGPADRGRGNQRGTRLRAAEARLSAGGRFPIGSRSRRLLNLNQSTHWRVANSAATRSPCRHRWGSHEVRGPGPPQYATECPFGNVPTPPERTRTRGRKHDLGPLVSQRTRHLVLSEAIPSS